MVLDFDGVTHHLSTTTPFSCRRSRPVPTTGLTERRPASACRVRFLYLLYLLTFRHCPLIREFLIATSLSTSHRNLNYWLLIHSARCAGCGGHSFTASHYPDHVPHLETRALLMKYVYMQIYLASFLFWFALGIYIEGDGIIF